MVSELRSVLINDFPNLPSLLMKLPIKITGHPPVENFAVSLQKLNYSGCKFAVELAEGNSVSIHTHLITVLAANTQNRGPCSRIDTASARPGTRRVAFQSNKYRI